MLQWLVQAGELVCRCMSFFFSMQVHSYRINKQCNSYIVKKIVLLYNSLKVHFWEFHLKVQGKIEKSPGCPSPTDSEVNMKDPSSWTSFSSSMFSSNWTDLQNQQDKIIYQRLINFPPIVAEAGQVCRAPYSPEGIKDRKKERFADRSQTI